MALKFSRTLPLGLDGVDAVVKDCVGFIDEHEVMVDKFGVTLVLHEALNNAVIHGNAGVGSLLTGCDIEVIDGTLFIRVKNEGPGFDWQALKAKHNINEKTDATVKEGGRGFIIYKLYGYDFTFNDDGRVVTLSKEVLRQGSPDA